MCLSPGQVSGSRIAGLGLHPLQKLPDQGQPSSFSDGLCPCLPVATASEGSHLPSLADTHESA